MKYANPDLREKLAAEYVLGTTPWRARRRLQLQLKTDPQLRRAVARWEQRLMPLAQALQEIAPPAKVWRAIQAHLHPDKQRVTLWNSVGFWRTAAALAAIAFVGLVTILMLPEQEDAHTPMMVAVMADTKTNAPAMTVSWEPGGPDQRALRIRVIGHAEMAPDTAWELWMLPGGDRPPASLGLISTHETQTVVVAKPLAERLDAAWGLAMSVEPRGGSPTGAPTGPVLYAGQCVKT